MKTRQNRRGKRWGKYQSTAWYIISSLVVLILSLVYELFSHGVTSYFMVGAFLVPLAGAGLSWLMQRYCPGSMASAFLASGVIWLTLGSIFKGVLEIYGTTNSLIIVFLLVGLLQLVAAIPALLFFKPST